MLDTDSYNHAQTGQALSFGWTWVHACTSLIQPLGLAFVEFRIPLVESWVCPTHCDLVLCALSRTFRVQQGPGTVDRLHQLRSSQAKRHTRAGFRTLETMGKMRPPELRHRIVAYTTVGICSVSQPGGLYSLTSLSWQD